MNKKCPMKSDGHVLGFCEQGKCGWWNLDFDECSIKSIAAVGFMLGKLNETVKIR